MAGTTLKPSQKAFLMLLMAEAREVSNSELTARYGISLTGEDSRALVEAKLAVRRKVGRGLAHELTDDGWAECKRELTAEYVKGTGPAVPALHALLGAVERYLSRAELSLGEVFTASDAPVEAPKPVRVAKPRVVKPAEVEKRIGTAYRRLAATPQGWVSLTDLRAALSGIDRGAVDQALMTMAVHRAVVLVPEENQKNLSDADRAAAIHIGGEDKHLLSIEAA
ncbi:hypothetical protein Cs7R123_61310 [Catellatospora sp. TT07R-123]|uniref:hypothetical protein n=1 Tax=Catellatospora sp. TT07R-123 TaxID=2733863 RepID=UPI001B1E1686|nr:hypothetical protein [Catellatospora sp. TT07R-123]GHJ48789.1 hypothetical protein Cs7R123_61310 [Catellatospora sp. TT07R-123]